MPLGEPWRAGKRPYVQVGLYRHGLIGEVLVPHRNVRPPVDETCGKLGPPSAERSAFLWCERARVLVGPGASEAPPIAPGSARFWSALFRL